jgi:hypothetical protein
MEPTQVLYASQPAAMPTLVCRYPCYLTVNIDQRGCPTQALWEGLQGGGCSEKMGGAGGSEFLPPIFWKLNEYLLSSSFFALT